MKVYYDEETSISPWNNSSILLCYFSLQTSPAWTKQFGFLSEQVDFVQRKEDIR